MDLSKLPKLSNSPAPPPEPTLQNSSAEPNAPDIQPPSATTPSPPTPHLASYGAAELWISIGLGLFLLLLSPNTVKYVYGKLTGTMPGIFLDPTPGAAPGAKCDYINWLDMYGNFLKREMYRDMILFWSDLAVTAFALVLILDGIVMTFSRKRGVIAAMFVFTLVATLGNLFYFLKTFNDGIAIMSAVAVIVGGYIAMTQWAMLSNLRAIAASKSARA